MTEFGFHMAVYALGLCWSLLPARRLGALPSCALAYPLGLAIWVFDSLLLALSPLSLDRRSLLVSVFLLALTGAAANLCAVRRSPGPGRVRLGEVVGFTALFTLGVWLATSINLAIWSNDSHHLVAIGRAIAHRGEIAAALAPELASRGVFQVMAHGASLFFDEPYFSANPSVLALAVTLAFPILALRGLRGLCGPPGATLRAVALVGLTTAAIATPYFMLVQYFYAHETYAAAAYLFLAASCFWLGEREKSPLWLVFAFPFLLALSLHRVEAPLVAMIFLAMALIPSELSRRILNWGLVAHSLLLLLWLALLLYFRSAGDYHSLRGIPQLLTPQTIAFIAAGVAGTTAGILCLQHPIFVGLRALAPRLIVAVMGILLLGAAFWKPTQLLSGLTSIVYNMASNSWGGIWFAFLVLGLLSTRLRPVPVSALLSLGPVATLAFVLLLASQQTFGVAWGDSGNRMLTYLVPTFSFYLLMVFGQALLALPIAAAAKGRSPAAT